MRRSGFQTLESGENESRKKQQTLTQETRTEPLLQTDSWSNTEFSLSSQFEVLFCFEVPEPNQCRGRLAEAVLLFLVNLTRPIDQRHQVGETWRIKTELTMEKEDYDNDTSATQPVPKFRSARREQEPRLVVKTTKRRMKVEDKTGPKLVSGPFRLMARKRFFLDLPSRPITRKFFL